MFFTEAGVFSCIVKIDPGTCFALVQQRSCVTTATECCCKGPPLFQLVQPAMPTSFKLKIGQSDVDLFSPETNSLLDFVVTIGKA